MRFAKGAVVTLTASPAAGSVLFTGWGGGCPGGAAPINPDGSVASVKCAVTMSQDQPVTASFSILADLNADGDVDCLDLAILQSHFNQTGATYAEGDLNGDGVVNVVDLSALLGHFGDVAPGAPPGDTSSCSQT
jgi:hypothetical protein